MRKFSFGKFAFIAVFSMFTAAFTAAGGHFVAAPGVALLAHSPSIPPDPWDGVRLAHSPSIPPDPWDGVRLTVA